MKNLANDALLVMGSRRTYGISYAASPTRLVALDPISRQPIVATWIYDGDVKGSEGDAFIDISPMRLLTVSSAGYLPVTLNVGNAIGCNNLMNIRTDDGSVTFFGAEGFLPPQPADNHDVIGIFSSTNSAVALRSDGAVISWGEPQYGASLPYSVTERRDIIQLTSDGGAFVLLGTTAPYVESWGYDSIPVVPANIAAMTDLVAVHATWGACCVRNNQGEIFAWGESAYGAIPPAISELNDVVDIIPGGTGFAILRSTGQVMQWGMENQQGMLPAEIAALTDIVRVIGMSSCYVALRSNGSIVAWGTLDSQPVVVPDYITALDNIVDVAGGSKGIVVLCADGTVKAWGWQLDFPSTLENVIAIYANKMCFVALKNDGTLVAWGGDPSNPLFNLGQDTSLVDDLLTDVRAVYVNPAESFVALNADNTLVAWGNIHSGGDNRDIPEGVQGNISYIKSIG